MWVGEGSEIMVALDQALQGREVTDKCVGEGIG